MSTRTSSRLRISIVACASLLTAWSVAERGVAQDSPEFGDEEAEAPAFDEGGEGGSVQDAPLEAQSAPMDAPAADRGYSDSAPDGVAQVDAQEQDDADAASNGTAPDLRFSAELAFFADGAEGAEGSHLAVSPLLGLGVGVSDSLEVAVAWGLNYQSNGAPDGAMSQDSESAFVIGNPHLSLTQHTQIGQTHFSFGAGAALPLASLPDDINDIGITASAYGHASAMRGNWNQWLWAPDRGSATVHFASHAVLDELLFGGEAAVAVLIPSVEEGDMAAAGQLAGEVGFATETVRVVLRVQGVATVTPGLDDPFQVSLDPYVAWSATDSATLSARLTVNADNPAGVEGAGIWALRVGANLNL